MHEADRYFLGGIFVLAAILMTTNGAVAEAIIDRGAKPYFIVGGMIATVFFISVGAARRATQLNFSRCRFALLA